MAMAVPAVLAAGDTSSTAPAGGTIIVYSFPSGAAVDLNGEYRGITPLRLQNVPPGDYLLVVRMAGCKNTTIPVTLYNGSTREIGVNLESESSGSAPDGNGSIAIDSSPGGASVTLDGKPAGQTPAGHAALVLNAVPSGSHNVTVDLAGYPPYTSTVMVLKNKVVKVNADFMANTTTAATSEAPVSASPIIIAPVHSPGQQNAVPLSPFTVIAAAGLSGLAAVFRRS